MPLFKLARKEMEDSIVEIPKPESDVVKIGGRLFKILSPGPDGTLYVVDPVTREVKAVRPRI